MERLMENLSVSHNNTSSFHNNNLDLVLKYAIPIVYGCICIIGLLGNGLVVLVTLRNRLNSVPSVYVLNLAVADFLFMVFLIFLTYQFASQDWIFGHIMCKIVIAVDGLNQFTSVYTLTLMSIDRYLAIAHALRSMSFRTVHNARLICLLIWVASAIFVLPLWMYGGLKKHPNGKEMCDTIWPYPELEAIFMIYTFTLGFALPLLITFASYVCMLRYLVITKRPSSTLSTSRKKSKRIAVLVFAIVAAFVVCWLPFYVIHLALAFNPTQQPSTAIVVTFILSVCLSYSNSCINPFIYTSLGRRYRMGILPIPDSECCRKGKQRGRRRVRRTLSGSSDMYSSRRSSNSQRIWSWRDKLTVVESVTYEEPSAAAPNHHNESSV